MYFKYVLSKLDVLVRYCNSLKCVTLFPAYCSNLEITPNGNITFRTNTVADASFCCHMRSPSDGNKEDGGRINLTRGPLIHFYIVYILHKCFL